MMQQMRKAAACTFCAVLATILTQVQAGDSLFPGQELAQTFNPPGNGSEAASDIVVIASAEIGGDVTLRCRPFNTTNTTNFPWVSMSPVGAAEWLFISHNDSQFAESETDRGKIFCVIKNDSLPPKSTQYSLTADYVGFVPDQISEEQDVLKDVFERCCSDDLQCQPWKSAASSKDVSYDFCHIPGQVCNATGGLVKLDMTGWNLSCTFPSKQVASFSSLRQLKMGQNTFTGDWEEIFFALSEIPNLEYVSITDVPDIRGQLSSDNELGPLCSMAKGSLRALDVSNSSLSGSIPECMVDSKSTLVFIDVGYNQLNGSIPDKFDNNTVITWFVANQNNLNGPIPKSWGSVTNMFLFNVSNNAMTGTLPAELTNNPSLIHILARNNLLTGSIPSSVGMYKQLITLDLRNNSISGMPSEWSTASGDVMALRVQAIRLSNNSLTGTIPQGLPAMPSLMELGLAYNNMNGTLPETQGSNFRNMMLFNVSGNQLSGSIPSVYSGMRMFRQLTNKVATRNGSMVDYTFVFDLQSNGFSGDIPEFLAYSNMASRVAWTSVNLTGNDFDNGCDESFDYTKACVEPTLAPAPAPMLPAVVFESDVAPAPAPGADATADESDDDDEEFSSLATQDNASPQESSSGDGGLSGGAIAGIVIGSLVGIILLLLLVALLVRRRKTLMPVVAPMSAQKFAKFEEAEVGPTVKSVSGGSESSVTLDVIPAV